MKAMAYRRLIPLEQDGRPARRCRIDPGDLCEIGDAGLSGLFPVTYPTPKGPKTRWLRELSGFLCCQNDYPGLPYPAAGYPAATIRTGGCGVCAAVMAIGALCGDRVPVREMRDIAVNCGARVSGGTSMRRLLTELCRRYHLRWRGSSDLRELKAHLAGGGCAVCNTAGRGLFSTGGHFVTALGLLNGRLCIGDPGLYHGKYRRGRRRAVRVSGELLLADAALLDEDCAGRSPRYYLLERDAA